MDLATYKYIEDRIKLGHLFDDAHAFDCHSLISLMNTRQLQSKEVLFLQGDQSNAVYLVLDGVLKVISNTADGAEVFLSQARPGTWLGEIAALDGQPRSASVIAQSACRVAYIEQTAFKHYLISNPEIQQAILRSLCSRIRRLTNRIEDMNLNDAPARLAASLLELAQTDHSTKKSVIKADINISQSDLANTIGASREWVNHLLGTWELAGLVELSRGKVSLLDLPELEKIAHARSII